MSRAGTFPGSSPKATRPSALNNGGTFRGTRQSRSRPRAKPVTRTPLVTTMTHDELIERPRINRATTLDQYLRGMRAATCVADLEAAIQAPFEHNYHGRTWARICKVRVEAGRQIVAAHPHAFYIPRFGERRLLECCGDTYKVGRGQNSTGVRYLWHYAGEWAQDRLHQHGFGIRAAYRMWEGGWRDYPHRCIALVDEVLDGRIPDPKLDALVLHEPVCGGPINYTVEANDADAFDRRASRPCECGATLFDWGGGHSEGFEFINWRCNGCPRVFTENMTRERFYLLRSRSSGREGGA